MSRKVYNWNKFNEELSPVKLYAASKKLDDIGQSGRSKNISNFATKTLIDFIDTKVGIKMDSEIFCYMDIFLFIGDKDKHALVLIPVMLHKGTKRGEVYYSMRVPFVIEILGVNDINIVKTSKYLSWKSDKDYITRTIDKLKNYLIGRFEKEYENEINIKSGIEYNRDTTNTIFNSLFDDFSKSFYDSICSRKDAYNTWKFIRDFDNKIMVKFFERLKHKLDAHKIDCSVGQVQEFIKNLKVNDIYAYKM